MLLAVAPDMGWYETALHDALDDHSVHGEWFSPIVTKQIVEVAPLTLATARRNELFAQFVKQTVKAHRAGIREECRTAIESVARAYREQRRGASQ